MTAGRTHGRDDKLRAGSLRVRNRHGVDDRAHAERDMRELFGGLREHGKRAWRRHCELNHIQTAGRERAGAVDQAAGASARIRAMTFFVFDAGENVGLAHDKIGAAQPAGGRRPMPSQSRPPQQIAQSSYR
jgi:hypothetical protein